jgi:hypothetical protein
VRSSGSRCAVSTFDVSRFRKPASFPNLETRSQELRTENRNQHTNPELGTWNLELFVFLFPVLFPFLIQNV